MNEVKKTVYCYEVKLNEIRMKKKLLFVLVGGLLLAGCTTPEVRKEKEVDNNLTFYSDTEKDAASDTSAPQQTPPQKPKETAPPVEAPIPHPVSNKKMYTTPPQMTIDTNKTYTATLKTDAGDITVALDAKVTPVTVNNFVFLAREKFYDGTIFHRVIKGFMIQGGDPDGTGMGGPGYQFDDEKFTGTYMRGTLAMANSGPNTNGSQFFIMHADNQLPPNYVIFGHVTSGLNVVDAIATAPTKPGGEGSSPVTPVAVRTIEVMENK